MREIAAPTFDDLPVPLRLGSTYFSPAIEQVRKFAHAVEDETGWLVGDPADALVHPLFMAGLIYSVASGAPMWRGDGASVTILAVLYGTTVVTGYLTSAFLGWLGLLRRGLLSTAWALLFTPVHWLLLSLAAWRALSQFVIAPYAWEKTEHGLAKHSRLAANMTRSLLELERYLSHLKEIGDLPTLADDVTEKATARQPRPSVAA